MGEAGQEQPSGEQELTPEQLLEEFRKLKVSDLVSSTLYTLAQIGYGKLDRESLDLDQARLAIDSIRALLPVVKDSIAADLARDFEQLVANLQLAYAAAARDAGEAPKQPETAGSAAETPGKSADEDSAKSDEEGAAET